MYSNSKKDYFIRYLLTFSGIVSIVLSLYLAYGIYFAKWVGVFSILSFKYYFLILSLEYFLITFFSGLLYGFFQRGFIKEFVKSASITLLMLLGLVFVLFWLHQLNDSRRLVIGYFALIFVGFDWLSKVVLKSFLIEFFSRSKFSSKVLVVAPANEYVGIVRSFDKNLDWSKKIVGVATDDKEQLGHIVHGNKVVTTCDNLLDYVTHHNIDEIMSFYELSKCDEKLKTAFSKIEEMGIKINLKFTIEGFDYIPKSLIRFDRIANVQCVSISRNFISPRKILGKKILDFSGGLIGFLIFVIAYIIVAPIIKFDSKGPVLFSQLRVGRNGRIFKCYKFRSMYTDAEERKKELMAQNEMQGLMFKLESDPRITRVGKFIRRTSIDELPQFLNVLKGDMSLVGTRPPTLDEYQYYEPQHKARVSMNPGLTGLWQVSGRSDIKNFEDVVKLDMQYIDNWSIYLDIKIILLTIKVVLFGKGAK